MYIHLLDRLFFINISILFQLIGITITYISVIFSFDQMIKT